MNQPKRYLITSALPYANGLKHVGHLAGAYIPADIYVRYLRAQKETWYLSAEATSMEQRYLSRRPKKELRPRRSLISITRR